MLTVSSCSSTALRIQCCVSTTKWLRERATLLQRLLCTCIRFTLTLPVVILCRVTWTVCQCGAAACRWTVHWTGKWCALSCGGMAAVRTECGWLLCECHTAWWVELWTGKWSNESFLVQFRNKDLEWGFESHPEPVPQYLHIGRTFWWKDCSKFRSMCVLCSVRARKQETEICIGSSLYFINRKTLLTSACVRARAHIFQRLNPSSETWCEPYAILGHSSPVLFISYSQ
jgi:hypothetical protein